MLDDGVIYEGRKATGRTRHLRLIPKSESFEPRAATPFENFPGTKGMLRDSREPEVAHPSGPMDERSNRYQSAILKTDTTRANALRSAGKQAFLSVVKETVELVALEAASKAVQEETERMEELRHSEMCSNGVSRPNRPNKTNGSITSSNIASITRWPIDPPVPQTDRSSLPQGDASYQENSSVRHSTGNNSSVNGHGHGQAPPSERRRRRSRNASMDEEEGGSLSFRSTAHAMEDEERETLLSLLTGAYSQVNELTDELQIALQKLHETEQKLKASSAASEGQSQQLSSDRNSSEAPREEDSVDAADAAAATVAPNGNTKSGGMFFKGFFPVDEGARSTPATVRQLQVEVQRLRQRVMQSNAKEDKYRANLARNQRLIAVMESQMVGADNQGSAPGTPPTGHSSKRLNGSSAAGSPDPKPLVDRVAELEEKLVNCSMENATAKQDHLAAKLRASQLEKNAERIRHELAKSRAMNDLLQNEIDRLQGTMSPEGEADGKGWRRWLGGVQEPLSPEPHPIRVEGIEESDSPVVVVRDLDNNQLVYAPGRSEFF